MGRIKTVLTKRMTLKLLKVSKERFTEDFEHNKKAVSELTTVSSPKLRNIIAGYATRLIRRGDTERTYRPPISKEDGDSGERRHYRRDGKRDNKRDNKKDRR